ncbi:MAG: ribonuclease III [Deltaproteobacteria bacterium]|nr:ribonuclease III [Deltaproteobacteria bacterium]
MTNYFELEEKLEYKFDNPLLLKEALSHSSFVNEQTEYFLNDNQRFEFLGDSILSFVISDILMLQYSEMTEGDLSKKRASLVNEFTLAKLAEEVELGRYIMLGKGEINTKGHKKNSILSDTFEAIIAAVYKDKGIFAVFDFIKNRFSKLIEDSEQSAFKHDYKTVIQEYAQSEIGIIPEYQVIEERGPAHRKEFKVALKIGEFMTEGIGNSKKEAAQSAAQSAVEKIIKK